MKMIKQIGQVVIVILADIIVQITGGSGRRLDKDRGKQKKYGFFIGSPNCFGAYVLDAIASST